MNALLLAVLTLAGQGPTEMVEVGEAGYLLMPPGLVCAPRVEDHNWAPFGRYLLARRVETHLTPALIQRVLEGSQPPPEPPAEEESLVLWNAVTRESREIWKLDRAKGRVQSFGWYAGTDVAYVLAWLEGSAPVNALYRVHGSSGRLQPVANDPRPLLFFPCPVRGIALLGRQVPGVPAPPPVGGQATPAASRVRWCLVKADGSVGSAFPGDLPRGFPLWSTDGRRAYWRVRGADGGTTWRALDVDEGTVVEVRQPTDLFGEPKEPELTVRFGWEGKVPVVDLVPSATPAVAGARVSGDSRHATLSPVLDGVAYVASDALFVRGLVKVDAAAVRAARAAAERAETMSRAKQCALAAIMYGADHDDVLPPAGDVGQMLLPYLKNESLLSGFVYTFEGGSLRDVKAPAETVMGHIAGPGGRAVAYLDGHVKWIPDEGKC